MRIFTAIATSTLAAVLSGCATGPTTTAAVAAAPVAPVAVAAAPAPTAAPAVTSDGSKVTPELRKKAASVGYFPRTRKGVAVFCRTDADIGTRIPTEKCLGEDQLADAIQHIFEAQDNLRRSQICSTPTCSGN